jgi:glycosyltransferase involved in cell wall biosynthesis
MLHIINRHCNISRLSLTKNRPEWFDREKCYKNLCSNLPKDNVQFHIVFDGNREEHFTKTPIIEGTRFHDIKAGTGSKSFREAINYALSVSKPEDILYFVEDDYLHRPGWVDVLFEGFTIGPVGYISLYDHNDKYNHKMYPTLASQIFTGELSHWRTVPSTTDTFAIMHNTLKNNLSIFMKYSDDTVPWSRDHERCMELWKNGVGLITSIPGYSTHCEPEYLSPCFDWSKV